MTFRWTAPIAAAWALTAAVPAQAEWMQATTRHFVVYADADEKSLRQQAIELERFDSLLRTLWPVATGNGDAEANRVTVYVLPDREAIQKLYGSASVGGFYIPRIEGSVAFTPRAVGGESMRELGGRTVLFHEYAHHFLLGNYAVAYPAWYSEGFAEFVGTVMERDGRLMLGGAAHHRGWGLLGGRKLPLRDLLAPPAKMPGEDREALYGRGWLLTHYLMFNPARSGQLVRYIARFNAGTPSVEAATAAFGDLNALDRELELYLERRSMPAMPVPLDKLGVPTVAVRSLSAGERALMPLRIRSTRGVNTKTAGPIYQQAKVAAAPYPRDPVVQGWLAEMAFDADDLDGADAAADAALAADPKMSMALLYKARVTMAKLAKDKAATPAAWTQARSWIVRANRADAADAAALALYYDSFGREGRTPSAAAIAGLYRANELVPQDRDTRFAAARQRVLDGDLPQAKLLLRSLASDPHAGANNPAGKLLAALDAGKTGADALATALEQAKGDEAKGDGKKGDKE